MDIHFFTFNPFSENTYLIIGQQGSCLVVDPGMMDSQENEAFDQFISEKSLSLTGLILTHGHIDHVLGVKHIEQRYALRARAHKDSKPVYEACPRVAQMYGVPYFPGSDPIYDLTEGGDLSLDGESIELRLVPGHAPGHLVLVDHESKQVVAGDTLFAQSIGRTDLPGGNHELLLQKIREELFTLGDDYEVWPGHGPSTTIGQEKAHNPFLQG
jgi:glyoxylase-like metal-dependent hydrolase (beta-lactamase superfamily II)